MFKNYFKIAIRNVARHKAYAAINIAGLAIGIAACLLLFTVVRYELSYDKFQPNYSQIYGVVAEDKYPQGVEYTQGIPFPALEALRTNFPQVTTGALFASYGAQVTVLGNHANNTSTDKKFIEKTGFFLRSALFKVFQYNWLTVRPRF
jgi:hypothetical protein